MVENAQAMSGFHDNERLAAFESAYPIGKGSARTYVLADVIEGFRFASVCSQAAREREKL